MEYDYLTKFEEINADMSSDHGVDVTVICGTYNHVNYIADTLQGFVSQRTDCKFEVLVYDDASTDGTSDIVRKYALRYPNLIRAFIAEKNTYADPLRRATKGEWRRRFARGKYIALCEGDDYWIDPEKLHKQWMALEKHPEYDMCACRAEIITDAHSGEISEIRPRIGNGVLTTEEVILGGGQFIATAGLIYRKSLLDNFMRFERELSLDYVRQIKGSLRGGIYYIDDKMVAYRRFARGSWTSMMMSDKNKLHEQWQKEKRMLTVLDEETNGKYHDAIKERMKAYLTFEEQLGNRKSELISMIKSMNGTVYLWGMGRRGVDFEDFCIQEGIRLTGVCDKAFHSDMTKTYRGNMIESPEKVLVSSDNIIASNEIVFNDLKNIYTGNLINLQEYMPFG